MEVENFAQQLEARLTQKVEDSPTHRKAAAVLASLMHATKAIPRFAELYAAQQSTLALYLTAGVFKLLKSVLEGDSKHEHNLDAYLLLLTFTLPQASPDALRQAALLSQFRLAMQAVLLRKDNTPLMTRLAVAVLSHSLAVDMTTIDFRKGEDRAMLLGMFQRAVASPRNNALSKESAKLVAHLLKNNPSVSGVIAEEAKSSLLGSLDDRKQLYLANVKDVIFELPVRLINDICHRVAANLTDIDAADATQELYLAQTYFFLEKMTPKLLPSTLEDMLLSLINSVPAGTQPEKVQLSYLQLLSESMLALTNSSEPTANKLLSPVLAVLLQLLLGGQKVGKFAGNLLNFIMGNCVRPSLWQHRQEELNLEDINLEDSTRDFIKIICLLQGMLSSRFSNQKFAASIVAKFISQLDHNALNETAGLIQHIVDFRAELEEKCFRKMMEAALVTFGVAEMLNFYPLGLEGDISQENFEERNNLWLLGSLEKTERAEGLELFNRHILPLIQTARLQQDNQTFTKQRREGYHLVEDLLWRCLKVFTRRADTNFNYEQVLLLIDNQLKRVTDNTLLQLAIALESLANQLAPLKYCSPAAEQLIKTLATILDLANASAKQVLGAIKALAHIAPKAYVKRVFDKNIEKLIQNAQAKILNKEEQKNLKNLEILMAVNSAIDLCDPSVATTFRISREELLLRLVSGLLSVGGTFQKKGYKYLFETLSAAPRSLYLQVFEMFESEMKVDSGAKHHRLAVIGRLWGWLVSGGLEENLERMISFIKTHLPEILLSVRDHNKGARNEGVRLMSEFTETMEQVGLTENFVETVCAGLLGERSEMKLATLGGIGVIIGKGYCTEEMFKEVLEIVLLLLGEKRQELYKGVVEFCKRGLLSLSVDKQKLYLPHVLQQLFEEDEEGKMEHRSILRHFLLRLVKRHGREHLEAMIPQQHRKMLGHTIKMENREKRKKKEQSLARYKMLQEMKAEKAAQESSSDDEEPAQTQNNQEEAMDIEEDHLEELDNTNNLLLKYDLEKEQFHFQKEQTNKKETPEKKERQQDEITFDEKGFMIIEERKRPRNTTDDNEEEENNPQKKDNENFKKKPKAEVHQVKESGETYRSGRAGGDVRLKDKPEPYAFIQFSSKALNKRFKKRAEHAFETLFEKKEGGLRGLKARIVGNR